MTTLPTGTLTFLFTDVEGSTPLWERHEATMRVVTARHDALLDGIIGQYGGRRVHERGEGDSLFVVFTEPAAAVACALAMAQGLLAEAWPTETPIRVRMGLHTGVAQVRAGDYYGPVVNRCARIRGLGHGGQILVSLATAALVRTALPPEATLRSVGAHSLKGIAEAEDVFQLCHPSLPADFPALLSPQAPKHNLPAQRTSLIGREEEQGAVLALLARGVVVTLTGPGGIGKTRLALAVAREVVDQYADGVWFVELAPIVDPTLVPSTVAQVLGVREEPGRSLTSTLVDHLKDKQMLLVLDNCEQVVAACATLVTTLLGAAPGLRVLVTSREALHLRAEQVYPVSPLRVPRPPLPALEALSLYEAVRLFIACARGVQPDFTVTDESAPAVAEICARLDGLPLAIELVAARSRLLSPEAMLARLGERLRVATGGARDFPDRQRTLRAALDWSYDLLEPAEQLLFARLAVFAGGCTLDSVEAVCDPDGSLGMDVLDGVQSLLDKSLVQRSDGVGGESRLVLLETVQEYARERLAASQEQQALRDRHLGWSVALAEEAAAQLTSAEQGQWLGRLETEHDNLRAALNWAREQRAGELGLRLAGALYRFWYVRGYLDEGRTWLEAALTQSGNVSPTVRATALNGAGNLAAQQGEYGRALAAQEEALVLWRTSGDRQGIAHSLNYLGLIASGLGADERAITLLEESLALYRELEDTRGIAVALNNLGTMANQQEEYGRAVRMFEESLAVFRELGDTHGIANALNNLGWNAEAAADHGRAAALREEALTLFRELGERQAIADTLTVLAGGWYLQGDFAQAAALLKEGLPLSCEIGAKVQMADGLEILAWLAAAGGQPQRTARLGGAAEVLREALELPRSADQQGSHGRAVQDMRALLGEEAFAAAWADGRAMSLEHAVALALDEPA